MSLDALPQTRAVLEQGRADGLHHGAQLFVSHRGDLICDRAAGEARPGEPLKPKHLMLWLSSGKPITAAAVVDWCTRSDEAGPRLDDPVAKYLAAFAAGGKGDVTIQHLLTHTGGFPDADPGYPNVSWEESIRRVCEAPLADGWIVGETAGYHPKSSWFILGELLRLWENEPATDAMHERAGFNETITLQRVIRSGFYGWWSVGEHRVDEVRPTLAPMYRRAGRELVETEHQDDVHLTRDSPGSSLRGTAADLGRFYLDLLDAMRGLGESFPQAAAELLVTPHRVGVRDRTFQHTVDFGLGVIIDSNRYGADTVPYGFGPHCSPRTFGHGGSQSSMAFCDPEHELVVAWATNGMCGEPKHQRRNRAINAAIYEDLGLGLSG
ncbi:serine hydrolase domain-containing protein [Alienimonas chondri]|uniref:Beta-lactamase-related domain-containing protein n=1 Tax=Alienimonas chondri TaxID=2681879 RepID=A0ABX1V8L8_9PLAN|nr:serine hydrolase domain-containing protein [Alienimonas chondri]NNJ24493.1 hypothetical protein [Alienimonas chondri]